MPRRIAALAAGLAFACAHGGRGPDNSSWRIAQTTHFVLRTDLPPEEARRTLIELETVRAALLAPPWLNAREPPGRIQAIEVKDLAELRESTRKGIDGYLSSDSFGERMLVLSGTESAPEQIVLKHELAHYLNDFFLLRQPRWVSEGLACYLETVRFDAYGGVILGEPSNDRLFYLEHHPVADYGRVLNMGSEMLNLGPEEGYAFESAAWLLLHWLVNARGAELTDYLGRLANAEDPGMAFHAVFPDLTAEELGRQLRRYLASGSFRTESAALLRWTGEVALRPLDASSMHATRAELLVVSPGPVAGAAALALAEIEEALRLDPGNPVAIKLRRSLPDADPKALGKGALAATRAHPDDWRAFMLLAEAQPEQGAAARSALERAQALAPENQRVLGALAWERLARGESEEALAFAVKAARAAPGNPNALDTLAVALAGLGRCDEAARAERRAIEIVPESAPPAAVAQLRDRLASIERACR